MFPVAKCWGTALSLVDVIFFVWYKTQIQNVRTNGKLARTIGKIVGGQVLENAKLINKLPLFVDLMRQEITGLRNKRRRPEGF